MSKLLDELLQSAGSGPAQLSAKVQSLGKALTPALANEASEAYKRAVRNGQAHTALGGAMVASMLYVQLGMRKESLEAHYDVMQLLFMRAESVEDYAGVHEGTRGLVKYAREVRDAEREYGALVLGADAAYFASEAASGNTPLKEKWLQSAIEDVLAAFGAKPGGNVAGATGEKLVSVLCAVAEELQLSGLAREPDFAAALRQLAAKTRAHVPPNFVFEGDPKRSDWMRRILASLPR